MTQVNYDAVAPEFDRRYAHNTFAGIERALARFVARTAPAVVIEIGCGTGHWLAFIAPLARAVVGVDRSWAMLERARMTASGAMLARATAEHLAFTTGGFDRAFCINALHHFTDQRAFMKECRRILRPGGAFLSVGLDPHAGLDQWWIYDYFPAALAADRKRYAPTAHIRALLTESGFVAPKTQVAHHVPANRAFEVALRQGLLERHSTSQLMVISDAEYEAGRERLFRERPILRSNLRLYATVAQVGPAVGLSGA